VSVSVKVPTRTLPVSPRSDWVVSVWSRVVFWPPPLVVSWVLTAVLPPAVVVLKLPV